MSFCLSLAGSGSEKFPPDRRPARPFSRPEIRILWLTTNADL
jgi:hypothetical protein